MPLQPIDREVVLQHVRLHGPCIPNDLKQALKLGDTILLGAMLSELASKGLVKISNLKRGGSPFYYDPQHPESLEKVAQYLGEKDKRTYDLLKEEKVLRDDEHEALTRVSLRNLKDYAVQINVTTPDGDALYWKHFLVPQKEAERIIRGEPDPATQAAASTPTPSSTASPTLPPITPSKNTTSQSESASSAPEQKKKRAKKEKTVTDAQQQLPTGTGTTTPITSTPTANGTTTTQTTGATSTAPVSAGTIMPLPSDEFTKSVQEFFVKSAITVLEQKLVKKGEIDFVIEMQTPIGGVRYFCKAKAKKANNEGDLAAAKLQGAARNLPTVYVTNGDLNKRAQEMLANELKGLVVKKLG